MKKKQSTILRKGSAPTKEKMKQVAKKNKNAVSKEEKGGQLPQHQFKKVKVKRGLAGLGLFAGEPIKKGEIIVEYIGDILTKEEADAKKYAQYLFEVNRHKTIDGSPRWNIARYANHSCDGNAESDIKKGRVFVKAVQAIKEGEEIVYDYGEEFALEYIAPIGCRCGSKKHEYGMKSHEEVLAAKA